MFKLAKYGFKNISKTMTHNDIDIFEDLIMPIQVIILNLILIKLLIEFLFIEWYSNNQWITLSFEIKNWNRSISFTIR